jgi:sterol desaturase/sphingolipid hydroxylase (fatty acid hydroxylase superfamily)
VLHIISVTLQGSLSLFCIFIWGHFLEKFKPVETKVDQPGIVRNCVIAFCFILVRECTYFVLALTLINSWTGVFSFIGRTDGGSILKCFGLGFAWLAARDFFYYWLHRLQHASKWLWAEHALHHSEESMNVTTSARHHFLEFPLTVIFVNIPLLYLVKPPMLSLAVVISILSLTELSNHMNLRLGLGRFSWMIATPQAHRIHHSIEPEHTDKNFAAFFPVWDVLFGTYYRPKKGEYPPTGLSSGERVTTTGQALLLPFTMWRKMISEAFSKNS